MIWFMHLLNKCCLAAFCHQSYQSTQMLLPLLRKLSSPKGFPSLHYSELSYFLFPLSSITSTGLWGYTHGGGKNTYIYILEDKNRTSHITTCSLILGLAKCMHVIRSTLVAFYLAFKNNRSKTESSTQSLPIVKDLCSFF